MFKNVLVDKSQKNQDTVVFEYDPNNLPPVHVISLNVGGKTFKVTNYTLMKLDGSLLEELCRTGFFNSWSFNWHLMDRDGNYFFDRDPHLFSCILSLYRTGSAIVPDKYLLSFHDELTYWRLWDCVETETNGTGSQRWLLWKSSPENTSRLRVKHWDKTKGVFSRLERAIEDAGLMCRLFGV